MRRWIALVLLFALCLVPSSNAAAEEEEAPPFTEFTLDCARELIAYYGWEGEASRLPRLGIRFWHPSAMQKQELPQAMGDEGYEAVYLASNCMLSVLRQDYGIDLEEYRAVVEDSGYGNIRRETVNGQTFLLYDEPREDDSFCRVAATEEGETILEFVFIWEDEALEPLMDLIIATICREETPAA